MLSDAERVDAQITMRMAREGRLHIFPTEVLEIINAFNKPAEKEETIGYEFNSFEGLKKYYNDNFYLIPRNKPEEVEKYFKIVPIDGKEVSYAENYKIIPKIEKEG